jgi:hypothetical protein
MEKLLDKGASRVWLFAKYGDVKTKAFQPARGFMDRGLIMAMNEENAIALPWSGSH